MSTVVQKDSASNMCVAPPVSCKSTGDQFVSCDGTGAYRCSLSSFRKVLVVKGGVTPVAKESQCTATAERVVEQHADMVYRLAFAQVRSKADADDVFQEVFLRYVQARQDFDSEEHIKAWLIRVTLNCSRKHLKSAWLRKVMPLPAWLEEKRRVEEGFTFELHEESEVHDAMQRLGPKYRAVIHLFYYEGCSVAEIGRILGVRESTVRTQLTRARAKLAKLLEEDM